MNAVGERMLGYLRGEKDLLEEIQKLLGISASVSDGVKLLFLFILNR